MPSYLLSTPRGFFFRMRVPPELQQLLGKRELKKFLKTHDQAIATKYASWYAAKALIVFNSLRGNPLSKFITNDMVVRIPGAEYVLSDDRRQRREELQDLIDMGIIKPGAQTTVATPEAPVIETTATPQVEEPKLLTLSKAVDEYFAHKRKTNKNFTAIAEKEARDPFKLLIEFLGDRPLDAVSDDDAMLFKEQLEKLPRIRTSDSRKHLTFNQLVDLEDKDVISGSTAGQRIITISSLFKWHKGKGHCTTNPFYGLVKKSEIKKNSAIKARNAFNARDLGKIFEFRFWTQHDFNHSWEYWLPLLLLHTGARVNELCQLEKKDIVEIDDIWCVSINDIPTKDEPEDVWHFSKKRIKNFSSEREIPVHSKLIELGFLRFVDSIDAGRLFPTIKPTAGKLSHYPCKRFNEEYLVSMGVKVPFKKTFYSFRHTVMNELKKQKVFIEERGQLAGHTPKTVTEIYGNEVTIDDMKALVERLNFTQALANVKPWNS